MRTHHLSSRGPSVCLLVLSEQLYVWVEVEQAAKEGEQGGAATIRARREHMRAAKERSTGVCVQVQQGGAQTILCVYPRQSLIGLRVWSLGSSVERPTLMV
jgi:hypothetical protein